MADKTPTKKAPVKRKPKPTNVVQFTVWNVNTGPVPESVVKDIEEAIQRLTLMAFNDGVRLLTQTSKA
jgi:hypothetical protein